MLLRPRQKELVNRAVEALHKHGNTLAVAPTGAGKTIMLSAIIGEIFKSSSGKACVLAHRDELTFQNEDKFRRVNPALGTGVFDASESSKPFSTILTIVARFGRGSSIHSDDLSATACVRTTLCVNEMLFTADITHKAPIITSPSMAKNNIQSNLLRLVPVFSINPPGFLTVHYILYH